MGKVFALPILSDFSLHAVNETFWAKCCVPKAPQRGRVAFSSLDWERSLLQAGNGHRLVRYAVFDFLQWRQLR